MSKSEKVLFVSGYTSLEGDVRMLMITMQGLSQHLDTYIVTEKYGEVYDYLVKHYKRNIFFMSFNLPNKTMPKRIAFVIRFIIIAITYIKIMLLCKRKNIDIICTIDRGISPKIVAFVSKTLGIPFVFIAAYPSYHENGATERFVLKQASLVLAHSKYLKSELSSYVRDADQIHIIPNGIERHEYNPMMDGDSLRVSQGIPLDATIVVLLGRLSEWKGQDDLIRAAAIVLKKHPNTYFLIGGRGPEDIREKLQQQIQDAQVSHNVRLLGYVKSTAELIAASNIVTMPSWEEPFGLVALEGMAMAKPVVSTRAGGVPEFVTDGVAGILVPPRDYEELARAICTLIDDPEYANNLGQNGRRLFEENYTTEVYIEKVIDTLQRVGLKSP